MMDAEVSTHSWQWLLRNLPIFACNILMWYTRNIYIFFSSTEQSRAYHLHYCRDDRIICCQIFYDLLLKSAFERIFNVMQLILVKIKWHVKWKYLIQKFHNICLSYYFLIMGTIFDTRTIKIHRQWFLKYCNLLLMLKCSIGNVYKVRRIKKI
jgi:hypothetical protein